MYWFFDTKSLRPKKNNSWCLEMSGRSQGWDLFFVWILNIFTCLWFSFKIWEWQIWCLLLKHLETFLDFSLLWTEPTWDLVNVNSIEFYFRAQQLCSFFSVMRHFLLSWLVKWHCKSRDMNPQGVITEQDHNELNSIEASWKIFVNLHLDEE